MVLRLFVPPSPCQECAEGIESCVLDLLDYCHRRLLALLSGCGQGAGPVEEVESDDSGGEDGLPSKPKLIRVS